MDGEPCVRKAQQWCGHNIVGDRRIVERCDGDVEIVSCSLPGVLDDEVPSVEPGDGWDHACVDIGASRSRAVVAAGCGVLAHLGEGVSGGEVGASCRDEQAEGEPCRDDRGVGADPVCERVHGGDGSL